MRVLTFTGAMEVECIPINCLRVVDWLTSRKLLEKGWFSKAESIRNQIVKEMKEISKIFGLQLSSLNPTFNEIKSFLEEAIDKEGGRNIFGSCKGENSARLNTLVNSFMPFHLGFDGYLLHELVQFNLGNLLKKEQKLISRLESLESKKLQLLKSTSTHQSNFEDKCKLYSIKGDDIEGEITRSLDDLNQVAEKISEKLLAREIQDLINYYYEFIEWTMSSKAIRNIDFDTLIRNLQSKNDVECEITILESSESPFLPLLVDANVKNNILNDLTELLSFLEQRKQEIQLNTLSSFYLKLYSEKGNFFMDLEKLENFSEAAKALLHIFEDESIEKLTSLYTCEQLRNTVIKELEASKSKVSQVYLRINEVEAKKAHLSTLLTQVKEEILQKKQRAKTLANEGTKCLSKLEYSLSKLFKNTRVEIVGAVRSY